MPAKEDSSMGSPDWYFFNQCETHKIHRRYRKLPEELPESLRFAHLNPKVAALLASKERSQRPDNEDPFGDGLGKKSLLPDINSAFQNVRNQFDSALSNDEDSQRYLFEEAKLTAAQVLEQLSRYIYFYEELYKCIPKSLEYHLMSGYNEFTHDVVVLPREWQTQEMKEQYAARQLQEAMTDEDLSDNELLVCRSRSRLASTDRTTTSEVGSKLTSIRKNKPKLGVIEASEDEDGKTESRVGRQSVSRMSNAGSQLRQHLDIGSLSRVGSRRKGSSISSHRSMSGQSPKGRTGKDDIFLSIAETPSDPRLTVLQALQRFRGKATGMANPMSYMQTINFQLSNTTFDDKGWVMLKGFHEEVDQNTILEYCIGQLQNTMKNIATERQKDIEQGFDKSVIIRYYGDTKKETLLKYRKSPVKSSPNPIFKGGKPRIPSINDERNEGKKLMQASHADGSTVIYYPSGRPAVVYSASGFGRPGFYTIVYEDGLDSRVLACFTPSGRGVCYHENGVVRFLATEKGGHLSEATGALIRKWKWPQSNVKITEPTSFQHIEELFCSYVKVTDHHVRIKLNNHVMFRCVTQIQMTIVFSCHKEMARFVVGPAQDADEYKATEETDQLLTAFTFSSRAAKDLMRLFAPSKKSKKKGRRKRKEEEEAKAKVEEAKAKEEAKAEEAKAKAEKKKTAKLNKHVRFARQPVVSEKETANQKSFSKKDMAGQKSCSKKETAGQKSFSEKETAGRKSVSKKETAGQKSFSEKENAGQKSVSNCFKKIPVSRMLKKNLNDEIPGKSVSKEDQNVKMDDQKKKDKHYKGKSEKRYSITPTVENKKDQDHMMLPDDNKEKRRVKSAKLHSDKTERDENKSKARKYFLSKPGETESQVQQSMSGVPNIIPAKADDVTMTCKEGATVLGKGNPRTQIETDSPIHQSMFGMPDSNLSEAAAEKCITELAPTPITIEPLSAKAKFKLAVGRAAASEGKGIKGGGLSALMGVIVQFRAAALAKKGIIVSSDESDDSDDSDSSHTSKSQSSEVLKLLQDFPDKAAYEIEADKDLAKLQRKARNLVDDWMEHYRIAVGLQSPHLNTIREKPNYNIASRNVKSARMSDSQLMLRRAILGVEDEPDTPRRKRIPSAPLAGLCNEEINEELRAAGTESRLGGTTVTFEEVGTAGGEGSMSPTAMAMINRLADNVSRRSAKSRASTSARSMSPSRQVMVATMERAPSASSGNRSHCPLVIRQQILGYERPQCRCSRHHIPFVMDLELDDFINTETPEGQMIVIMVVSSLFPGITKAEEMLNEIYGNQNRNRTRACVQSRSDMFRVFKYDINSAAEMSDHTQPLLQIRHNVVPGMILIYCDGKLLFCDHIFNGYGNTRKDFKKQIMKSRHDYIQGFSLPKDFRFSPSKGQSGMRSAWGGEIGGAGVDKYSSSGTVVDSSLMPIHRPSSSSSPSSAHSRDIQLDAVKLEQASNFISMSLSTTGYHPAIRQPGHSSSSASLTLLPQPV